MFAAGFLFVNKIISNTNIKNEYVFKKIIELSRNTVLHCMRPPKTMCYVSSFSFSTNTMNDSAVMLPNQSPTTEMDFVPVVWHSTLRYTLWCRLFLCKQLVFWNQTKRYCMTKGKSDVPLDLVCLEGMCFQMIHIFFWIKPPEMCCIFKL